MKQGVSLITLGVSDYDRAKSFYEALGWSVTLEIEETAFFQANGVVVVLWAREKLAGDMGIPDDGANWSGIALAHNVGSREEVDQIVEQARVNGATITREPSERSMAATPAPSATSTATCGRSRTIQALASRPTAASSSAMRTRSRPGSNASLRT